MDVAKTPSPYVSFLKSTINQEYIHSPLGRVGHRVALSVCMSHRLNKLKLEFNRPGVAGVVLYTLHSVMTDQLIN